MQIMLILPNSSLSICKYRPMSLMLHREVSRRSFSLGPWVLIHLPLSLLHNLLQKNPYSRPYWSQRMVATSNSSNCRQNSHVLPASMRRFHEAKVAGATEVVVWGTGLPLREFLYVDDLADAVVFLMNKYSGLSHLNVGSGKEVTIKQFAELVKEVMGFEGKIIWDWDSTKPDGTPRKLTDSSKLEKLGWSPKISLKDGLVETYK